MGSFYAFFRLLFAIYALAREGVFSAISPSKSSSVFVRIFLLFCRAIMRKSDNDFSYGKRVSAALNRLGPSYVKLGQTLAVRPDLIGKQLASELEEILHDNMEAVPVVTIKSSIENCLGRSIEDLFEHIGEAIAAASVAQVHRASIIGKDGKSRVVAVKVLRPGIKARFNNDLETFYLAARLAEYMTPECRRVQLASMVDVLAQTVKLEMDLRLEAAAIVEMSKNTINDAGLSLPVVEWEYTGKEVLTVSWIDGIKVSAIKKLNEAGHDLVYVSRLIIQSFLLHAIRDGFFHADMHTGNIFVDPQSRLVLVDFGIMGRLSKSDRYFLAEVLHGFISGDYKRVAEVHFEAGLIPNERISDFAQAICAIGEPIKEKASAEISVAKLLGQLLDYAAFFDMKTQPHFMLLQKTMMVVEGVARKLNPKLDICSVSEPIVKKWIGHSLGISYKLDSMIGRIGSMRRLARQLPMMAQRLDRISSGLERMAEKGVTIDSNTINQMGAARERRDYSIHLAVWVIALSMVVIAITAL